MKIKLGRQLLTDIKNTPTLVRQNTETAVVISVCALSVALLAFIVVLAVKKPGGEN